MKNIKNIKKIINIDCLNCILKFLEFNEQSKYVFSINKVLLDYYLNSYHGVFNCSLSDLDCIFKVCKNIKQIFKFLDNNTVKKKIIKNVRCINIKNCADFIPDKLKPKKVIISKYVQKLTDNTIEIRRSDGLLSLMKQCPILNIKKLILDGILYNLYNVNRLEGIIINCKQLFIENMDLSKFSGFIRFIGVQKLVMSKCLGKSGFYSRIVEDNSEIIEYLRITNFLYLNLKNKPLKKLKCLKIAYSKVALPEIENLETLQIRVNHFYSESSKIGTIKNLNVYFKSWDNNSKETFKKRLNFLKFLRKPKNLILRIEKDENLYYFFRECLKSNRLKELKILYETDIRKIKTEIENLKFKKISIFLHKMWSKKEIEKREDKDKINLLCLSNIQRTYK